MAVGVLALRGGLEEGRSVTERFELLLFATDADLIRRAVGAGVDGIVVDWENRGKEDRQQGADTQINYQTVEDLRRVRAATEALVICRIDGFGASTGVEVEAAVDAGADEILLPMVRSVTEVEKVQRAVADRCSLGILVETEEAIRAATELGRLPLSRVYVGLNDLAIQRQTQNLFTAVADGTVETVRREFPMRFGFAGLTLPDRGFPIPCRLLIGEMARLRSGFGLLRRSFLADTDGQNLADAVAQIRNALAAAERRAPEQVDRDRSDLPAAITAWAPAPIAR